MSRLLVACFLILSALPVHAQEVSPGEALSAYGVSLQRAADLDDAAALLAPMRPRVATSRFQAAAAQLQARLDREAHPMRRLRLAVQTARNLGALNGRVSEKRAAPENPSAERESHGKTHRMQKTLREALAAVFDAEERRADAARSPRKAGEPPTRRVPRTVGAVREVPFASQGNRVMLAVSAAHWLPPGALTVRAVEVPRWITLAREVAAVEVAGDRAAASFSFDVGEAAPVGRAESLVLRVTDAGGRALLEREIRLKVGAPARFALQGSYPNPFGAGGATIAYDLPQKTEVRIEVYDVLGRRVAVLVDGEEQPAGRQTVRFSGAGLASGLYLYRVRAGKHTATGQMTLVR